MLTHNQWAQTNVVRRFWTHVLTHDLMGTNDHFRLALPSDGYELLLLGVLAEGGCCFSRTPVLFNSDWGANLRHAMG